ncbi:uncharacterized protein LOC128663189 isoform X2 [Bombina bombina]|uniref:uncharacterized protein LOC128663189 isoform X2 n=1 Tax=Bombina bombina TaxID=8345 RepID=UPI00235AB40E|nr:uncharacterized protein LOC128663189 isoform X2 [Bombina bombina]
MKRLEMQTPKRPCKTDLKRQLNFNRIDGPTDCGSDKMQQAPKSDVTLKPKTTVVTAIVHKQPVNKVPNECVKQALKASTTVSSRSRSKQTHPISSVASRKSIAVEDIITTIDDDEKSPTAVPTHCRAKGFSNNPKKSLNSLQLPGLGQKTQHTNTTKKSCVKRKPSGENNAQNTKKRTIVKNSGNILKPVVPLQDITNTVKKNTCFSVGAPRICSSRCESLEAVIIQKDITINNLIETINSILKTSNLYFQQTPMTN